MTLHGWWYIHYIIGAVKCGSTGVISPPHRKPVWNSGGAMFHRVSEAAAGLYSNLSPNPELISRRPLLKKMKIWTSFRNFLPEFWQSIIFYFIIHHKYLKRLWTKHKITGNGTISTCHNDVFNMTSVTWYPTVHY